MYRTCQWCNITSYNIHKIKNGQQPFFAKLHPIFVAMAARCDRPEHPNPLFQRETWMNLNGPWQFAICPEKLQFPPRWEGTLQVPFCLQSPLSGALDQLSAERKMHLGLHGPPLHWLQDFQREKPCGMPNPWCCPPGGAWRARRCGFMWAPVTLMRRSWWMEEVVAPTWGEIRHSAWILPQHCEVMELMEKWRSTSNAPIPQVWISQLESSSAGQESTRARAISGPFIQTSLVFGKLSGWRPVPSNTWLVCRWWPNWRNWISGIWSCKQKSPPKLEKLWNWWLLSSQIEAVEIRFVKAPNRSMTPRTWPFNSWCPRKKRNSGARKIRICMVSSYMCRTKEGKRWIGSPPMLPWEESPAMETRSAWMEIPLSCGWCWIKVTTPMPGFCWVRGQGWFSRKIHRLNGESTESTEIAQESSS